MKILKVLGIIFGVLLIYGIGFNLFVHYRFKFKPIVAIIVNLNLSNSCQSRSSCNEIRPLPKPLQGKKIVFNDNTNIEFDPFGRESQIDGSQMDLIGYIDTELNTTQPDEVGPLFGKRGFLKEREYKIIRAVYKYKCFYCIDSDNLAYIVLEDSKGNRFLTLLRDIDLSVNPGRNLLWDEYLPYFIGKDIEGNDLNQAKLVNI
jgi:hypothetical protein